MELLLLTVYLLLQVGDFWTTTKVLSQGGTEQNGLVRELMNLLGVIPALIIAKGLGALAGVLLWNAGQLAFLAALNALYAFIVYRNYTHIK